MSLQTPNKPISASEPTTPIKKRIKFSPMPEFENNRNDPYKHCSRSLDFSEEEISKKRTEGFTIFSSDKNELRKNLTNKKFCKKVIKYGFCNTENCTFAHTIEEFNPECIFGEACKYQGLTCNFLHPGESFVEYCKKLNIDERYFRKSSPLQKESGGTPDRRLGHRDRSGAASPPLEIYNTPPSTPPKHVDRNLRSDYLDTSSESDKSDFSPPRMLNSDREEESRLPPPYLTIDNNKVVTKNEKATFTSPVFLPVKIFDRLNINSEKELKYTTCIVPANLDLIKYLIKLFINDGYKRIDFEFTDITDNVNTIQPFWRIPADWQATFYMVRIAIKDNIKKITIEFCE